MHFRLVERIIVAVVLLLIAAGFGHAQTQQQCRLERMIGEVKVRRSASVQWVAARPGMVLRQDDAVRTFVESEAVIGMRDGSVVTLRENTTLELATLAGDGGSVTKTGLKILVGDLTANVKKLTHKQSSFEFETPTAVAAIRGTRLGIAVDNDKTSIRVYEGEVYVTPKGSKTGASLTSHEMTTVVKGQQNVVVEKFEAKEEVKREAPADTTTPPDTATQEKKGVQEADEASIESAAEIKITLKIVSPENGQIVRPGAPVTVFGAVTPPQASVKVQGSAVTVSSGGEFRFLIQNAPSDEGQYEVTVDAEYQGASQSATRYYVVKRADVILQLAVNEPVNGQVFAKPLIRVSGTVTPGAELSVSGMAIPVAGSGAFSKDIPVPDEEGDIVIEVEATMGTQVKTETRTVVYRAPEQEIVVTLQMPSDKQVVCAPRVQVKGTVKPATVEAITVNGRSVPVRSGMFNDYVLLPAEQGAHELDFEVVKDSKTGSLKRTVRFEPAGTLCNKDAPVIQPASLPVSTRETRLAFTVYDKTLFDEITFYASVDGSMESATGKPGSRFFLDLEEGIHKYEMYAEDLCGNRSPKITGEIKHLRKDLLIRMRSPSGPYYLIHIPPGTPDGAFFPEFTVEFSVENLPDDNPKLLKEVKVVNRTSGDVTSLKTFTNTTDFDFDIRLSRGKNQVIVELRDINDRIVQRDVTIEVR